MGIRPPPGERSPAAVLSFGVVNLDKPPGPSAHQVSAWIRDLVGVEKAAHAGTLDPKVTGCLPVLTGTATRIAPALLEGFKEYVAVLELHDDPPRILPDVIEAFTGEIYQKPPKKSAVARRLRTRTVYDLDVLDVDGRQVLLRIRCESGTYIRKLCHDIGRALGTNAHMGHLRRSATTPFDDTDLVTLHDLADAVAWLRDTDDTEPPDAPADALRAAVQPAERALTHLPRLTIADSAAHEVATGAPVYAPGVIDTTALPTPPADGALVACYTAGGTAVCLGRLVGDPDADAGVVVALERVLV
ncbi:RNA-guided pseudouridylation complex pseudouridine synthase subunit Cbf5 [Halobacterium salinarum]|uniref:Probable tRNA pseudouridine synthase B n=7 Tax=Halobacterium salinarum TaxID=2242 RepID=TRUB_HALSA|nr:RNA-guided pseudouridylation complex pseudouridine synthase subunit Cbf5 [Halobacterium salinarum]B0R686.1 RecName: Full=Probable tRNA pseudouridine synthase B; AltName: Full=tRNA pseudouridine(55) synthase; Short=Psi55 synthase; AltName: Full=tRNA pseudouridylate synthase; AltName: Full=tRNA-uridine isomerase [Halobacterium salinarum R1]Q9HPA4.1 RecName: Full=Probable tRNA pseudouridine synthase B; AltName: Full=tRNA pseudouridine(55) synthase; Short=Psi55 synthase; AltName: Full=tRNA pseudou